MNPLLDHALVFAQHSRLDDLMSNMSGGFREHGPRINAQLFATQVAVVLGVLVVLIILARGLFVVRRRYRASPTWLFRRLCHAHHLTWRDGRLLRSVARLQKISDLALVFIEPQRLDPANLPPRMLSRASRLEELRGRLFSMPAAQTPAFAEPHVTSAADADADNLTAMPLFPPLASTAFDAELSGGLVQPGGSE